MELNFISKNKPDFDLLVDVLKGIRTAPTVLSAELLIDDEIKKFIVENYLNEKNCPTPVALWGSSEYTLSFNEKKKAYEKYYKQIINFYYLMGYSLFADLTFTTNFEALNTLIRKTKDTASFSKGERYWAVEGTGLIKSWGDFEKFPWVKARSLIVQYESYLEFLEKIVPEGMKVGLVGTVFEEILEWILGYEGLFYMISDTPELVEAVFNKVGKIMYDFYSSTITSGVVGCICHADDLGFKSGTMISTELLKKWVFPWFKKYASIAHKYGKPFFLHSCGNKDKIMDILIDDVEIDAIHSFEDSCCPVTRYKKQWGDRVGIIGGVDMDKLVRLDKVSLRKYIRGILDACMQNGRYVLGSGNSVCNYIPIDNYLIMLDEALKWRE